MTVKKKKGKKTEQGFSLAEAVASLTLLTICMAFSMPLFLYARLSNIKSELRTGAIITSQQILDGIRQQDVTTLPATATTTTTNAVRTVLGHTYDVTYHYCENISYCTTGSRQVRLEIQNNGTTIYSIEAVYTQFN